MNALHTPEPNVDDLQRELLAICKGHDNYETWARVSGQPINARVNEVARIGKRAAVHDLRLRIHAINPDAALYFSWCPGEDGPSAKREFFAAVAAAREGASPAPVSVMNILNATDDHLQGLRHYRHSRDLRQAMSAVQDMQDALVKLADAVETRRPEHEGYLAMCAQEARAVIAKATGSQS